MKLLYGNMDIKYKIKKIQPNIYAVIVPDDYHRPMLFMRAQEYYESPNPLFKGKSFNIWDYIEWYSRNHRGSFTYAFDWGGFNIPLEVGYNCYDTLKDVYTPYDEIMENIIHTIYKMNGNSCDGYIIGVGDMAGETFRHEVCHGLYATNHLYKEMADEITQMIPTKLYNQFVNNLIEYGYSFEVMDDEVQAYLMSNWETTSISKKTNRKEVAKFSKLYRKTLESFINNKKSPIIS